MDEFAVAMYLIYAKLGGKDLPTVLPPELIPPSTRDLNSLAAIAKQEVITNLSAPKKQMPRNISAASFGESSYDATIASDFPAKIEESKEDRASLLATIEAKRKKLSDLKNEASEQNRSLRTAEEDLSKVKREVLSLHKESLRHIKTRDQMKLSVEKAKSQMIQSGAISPAFGQASVLEKQVLEVLQEVRLLESKIAERKMDIAKAKGPVPQSSASNLSSLLSSAPAGGADSVSSKAAALLAARMAALGVGGAPAASASPAQAEVSKIQEERNSRLKKVDESESRIQSLLREIHSLSAFSTSASLQRQVLSWNPSIEDQVKYEDGVGIRAKEVQKVVDDMKESTLQAKKETIYPIPLPTKEPKVLPKPAIPDSRPTFVAPAASAPFTSFSKPEPVSVPISMLSNPPKVEPVKLKEFAVEQPSIPQTSSPLKTTPVASPLDDKRFDVLQRAQEAIKAAQESAMFRRSTLSDTHLPNKHSPSVGAQVPDLSYIPPLAEDLEKPKVYDMSYQPHITDNVVNPKVQEPAAESFKLPQEISKTVDLVPGVSIAQKQQQFQTQATLEQLPKKEPVVVGKLQKPEIAQALVSAKEPAVVGKLPKFNPAPVEPALEANKELSRMQDLAEKVNVKNFAKTFNPFGGSVPQAVSTPAPQPLKSTMITESLQKAFFIQKKPDIDVPVSPRAHIPAPPIPVAISVETTETLNAPESGSIPPPPPPPPAGFGKSTSSVNVGIPPPPPPPMPGSSSGIIAAPLDTPTASLAVSGGPPPPPPPPMIPSASQSSLPRPATIKNQKTEIKPKTGDLESELKSALKSFRSKVAEDSNGALDSKNDGWSNATSLNNLSEAQPLPPPPVPAAGGPPPPPPPPPTLSKSGSFLPVAGSPQVDKKNNASPAVEKKKTPAELGAKGPNLFGPPKAFNPADIKASPLVSGKIKGLQGNIAQIFGAPPAEVTKVSSQPPKSEASEVPAAITTAAPIAFDVSNPFANAKVPEKTQSPTRETAPTVTANIFSDNPFASSTVEVQPYQTSIALNEKEPVSNGIYNNGILSNAQASLHSPVKSSALRQSEEYNPFEVTEPAVQDATLDDIFGDSAAYAAPTGMKPD